MIRSFCTANKCLSNRQPKWELLKYEVRRFNIIYTKQIAKEKRQQRIKLENQLKILEKNLDENDNSSKYNNIKNELDAIYDHNIEGIRVRNKCNWYKHNEKSTKICLNLEKQRGAQNTLKKLIVDDKETTDQTRILECIKEFYETLFKKREQKIVTEIKSFLSHINIPKLSEDKRKLCEEDLTEKDLCDSLKSMQNDKSPGNDGLTKNFMKHFGMN